MSARSLGEVEALVRKAARGAGRSWGMAEEAGRAARWLETYGLPGGALAAALLEETDGVDQAALMPRPDEAGAWRPAGGGGMCPIAAGAALSDMAAIQPGELRLGPVLWPLMMLPHLAQSARQCGRPLRLICDGLPLEVTGAGAPLPPPAGVLAADRAGEVLCRAADETAAAPLERRFRADAAAEVIARLETLAARIYAPETPERRLSGAGAGLTDND